MSKFRCPCGFIVVDNGAITHHMGQILREQQSEPYHERATREISEFIQAIQAGKRKEWIGDYYANPGFDLDDSSVVFDIWTQKSPETMLDIFQCDACGRIFIERAPHTFIYRSFKPENNDWQGTLAVELPPQTTATSKPPPPRPKSWWKFW